MANGTFRTVRWGAKRNIYFYGFLTPPKNIRKIRAWKLQIGGFGYIDTVFLLYGNMFRFIRASASIKQKIPMVHSLVLTAFL